MKIKTAQVDDLMVVGPHLSRRKICTYVFYIMQLSFSFSRATGGPLIRMHVLLPYCHCMLVFSWQYYESTTTTSDVAVAGEMMTDQI